MSELNYCEAFRMGRQGAMATHEVLQNPPIHCDERDDEAGIYVFRIGELQTPIALTIRPPYRGSVVYEISHSIRTPLQASPYLTSHPRAGSQQGALRRALDDLRG